MYSHVACDVMKERTLYLLKPSSLIWHLMPYLFFFYHSHGLVRVCEIELWIRCARMSVIIPRAKLAKKGWLTSQVSKYANVFNTFATNSLVKNLNFLTT